MCRKLFKVYKICNGQRLISEIVTSDKTWIFYFKPQKKIDKIWLTEKAKRNVIAIRCQST